MNTEGLFDRSGSRLKSLIPRIFKWNVILIFVGVIITFFAYLINEDFEEGILALVIGAASGLVEIGVMYFWMLNLYAHAEQSENTFRILRRMEGEPAAAPVAPAPQSAKPAKQAPVYDVPAAKPIVKPAEKKEEAKPAPAPEKVPPKPLDKINLSSFGEALSFALRFETDEGMRRQLLRLTEQEEFSSYREELLDILEEVPSAQQRSAAEALLQKYS